MHSVSAAAEKKFSNAKGVGDIFRHFLADAFCEGLRIILFILSGRVLQKISLETFLADAFCD